MLKSHRAKGVRFRAQDWRDAEVFNYNSLFDRARSPRNAEASN